jgi:hypothetical protein
MIRGSSLSSKALLDPWMGHMSILACCSQDMCFLYMLSGWEGSTADATLFLDTHLNDLTVPEGKYYLADADFGSCDTALVPYRSEQYHLAEWGWADIRYLM